MIGKNLQEIRKNIPTEVTLIAVSKTKPTNAILEAYNAGQRIFGENKVQEMATKHSELPKDISWHMIGHLQRNKVKYMASFVHLIHGIDNLKLLQEIDKQAKKHDRIIDCLLQIKIASEETKFGLSKENAMQLLASEELKTLQNIQIVGLMGMATFTENVLQIETEFKTLKTFFDKLKAQYSEFKTLSMGMSADYKLAISCGSNMVRVGNAIFGSRNYN